MAYATAEDLENLTGLTPSNANRLLTLASRDIDRALLCSVYDSADADVIEALKEATCEQVAGYLAQGLTDGIPTGYASVGLGPVTLTRDSRAPAQSSVSGGVDLAPQAFAVLQAAGLTGYGPAGE